MSEITTVGLDLAKNVFQLHGADASGRAVLRRKLRRAQVLEFLLGSNPALWLWRPAAALTSGVARSASWGTRFG